MSYPQATYPQHPAQSPYPQAPAQYPAQVPQQPQAAGWGPGTYGSTAQQPPQAPAQGTVSDFFGQPSSGGGPSFKFNQRPIGTRYSGIVARRITNADIRSQTDPNGLALTYRDGRPKLVMVVPMLTEPGPEFPEGTASWWVKGQARDELVRAMAEAGAPEGPPEDGAAIEVTLTGHRPIPGRNPQHIYQITYIRPQQAPQAQPAPAASAVPVAPVAVPSQPQAGPAPVAQAVPDGLTSEQQALLARLTGGQAA